MWIWIVCHSSLFPEYLRYLRYYIIIMSEDHMTSLNHGCHWWEQVQYSIYLIQYIQKYKNSTTRMNQADDIFNLAFWQSLHSHCIFIRWLPRTNSGYVWGQRINYLKNLMMASLKEQTKDLTTCSIYLETFNEGRLKPKFLFCAHTFCLKGTKVRN